MPELPQEIVRLSDLQGRTARPFTLVPDAAGRAAVANALGIIALRKLRFEGELLPEGRRDWRLVADLGATVVQECGVTLAPVTTRIDENILRRYLAGAESVTLEAGAEIEMPDDDTVEPLPGTLDLGAVMIEALALALPPFPRAPDAELGTLSATPPGAAPLDDAAEKPFAGLAALRNKLDKEGD
ncbi:MAG: DUF177 domain-containing protein [Limimaricola sp.]|uniref:YceD family protein n=1 Tax=Limimaricola sp. TaxID=2211665 RepID=UPI001D99B22C|nr:DUF177 domain-containing protein [Limimaricola sp.]MBI1418307.1 DUF177 domain-containing protein [Limimaricola sp.]